MKKVLYVLPLCLVWLAFATHATAQFYYSATPLMTELEALRGKDKEENKFGIEVVNGGPGTARFRVYIRDFEISPAGKPLFPEIGTSEWSCAKWIKMDIEEPEFTLKPGEIKKIKCILEVPRRAKGGKYAAILVEPVVKLPKLSEEVKAVIKLPITRTALLVFATVKGRKKIKAEISSLEVKREEEKFIFTVAVKNKGNVHFLGKGKLTIKDKTGRKWVDVELKAGKGTVLPEGTRNFVSEISIRRIPAGDYVVRATIKYGRKRTFTEIPLTITPTEAKAGKALPIDFDLEPEVLEVETSPGAYRSKAVKFHSNEAETIHIKVRAEDVEGLDPKWSCAEWLKIQPTEFDLRPGKRKSVKLILSDIPEGTTGGRYVKIISSATMGSEAYPSGKETILMVTIPNTLEMSGELTGLDINRKENRFVVKFHNTGNVHLEPKGTLIIKDKETLNIVGDKIPFGEELILPDESKEFTVPLPLLEEGNYVAEAVVSYNEETASPLTKEFVVKF